MTVWCNLCDSGAPMKHVWIAHFGDRYRCTCGHTLDVPNENHRILDKEGKPFYNPVNVHMKLTPQELNGAMRLTKEHLRKVKELHQHLSGRRELKDFGTFEENLNEFDRRLLQGMKVGI